MHCTSSPFQGLSENEAVELHKHNEKAIGYNIKYVRDIGNIYT